MVPDIWTTLFLLLIVMVRGACLTIRVEIGLFTVGPKLRRSKHVQSPGMARRRSKSQHLTGATERSLVGREERRDDADPGVRAPLRCQPLYSSTE